MIIKNLLCVSVLLLFAVLLSACGPSTPDTTLKVGMDLSYPPFESIDASGEPVGVSVDLARALGESLGRPVKIENIPFVGLIPALKTGKVDVVISSMTDTAERRESIAFSEPYLSTGLGMLTGKDSGIRTVTDLDQPTRTVAVRQGTTGEVWARAQIKNAKILALEKEASAVLEVIQGRADAFIYDQMSVWTNWTKHAGQTEAVLEPIQRENWAIGLRQDDEELRTQVNAFLAEFRTNGGFDRLGDKHLTEQKKAFAERGIPFFF